MGRIFKYCLILLIYTTLVSQDSHPQTEGRNLLTVDMAVEIAKQNSPLLGMTDADISISQSRVRKAKSNYYPHIESRLILPLIGTESGITLDQQIWDFGRTSSLVRSMEFEVESSRFEHERTTTDIVTNTKTAYYRTLIARSNLVSDEKKVERQQLNLMKVQELVDSGRMASRELTEANFKLARSRLQLSDSQNLAESTKMELFEIMGIDPDSDYELVENLEYDEVDIDFRVSENMAEQNNMELRSLQASESGIRARIDAKRSEFLPVIIGRTAYRLKGKGADIEGTDTPSFIAGVGIRFPIFLGFSRLADLDEINAQLRRTQAQSERARNRISSQVRRVYMDLNNSMNRISVTEKNLQVAKNNLELIEEKLNMGRASKLELVEAEAFYLETLSDYKEAVYLYKITRTNFEQITGNL